MAAAPNRLVSLFKQGWHEIPEVVGSSIIAIIGLGFGAVGLYRYQTYGGERRRYKAFYTVMRSDDPRMKYVRND